MNVLQLSNGSLMACAWSSQTVRVTWAGEIQEGRERILQSGHDTGPGEPVPDLRMRCRAFRHKDERGTLDCGKLVVITRSEEVQC